MRGYMCRIGRAGIENKYYICSMGAVNTIMSALQTLIPSFTKSNASIEAKIIDVVGTYADTEKIERDNTLEVIGEALATQKVTTIEYYRRKAVAFQLGDTLVYDPINQGGYYETIDTESQIVKQAYIVGSYPIFTLLVNKIGPDGHLTTLTSDELASFKTYFQAFQPLGLNLNINSLNVAQISDPGIIIYVRAGSDATTVADQINANLTANEAVLRSNNKVSLTEISDIIQSQTDVLAVSFSSQLSATEEQISGQTVTVLPTNGLFNLTNGAFTFATQITPDMIKVLQ